MPDFDETVLFVLRERYGARRAGGSTIDSLKLLVGADEFWACAKDDIASANRRILVQAMTFEGDDTGLAVAKTIRLGVATDRRVLVDDYTRVNVNDTRLASHPGRSDVGLQAEVRATDQMFRGLVASEVPVRITNRIGAFGLNYPCRNHKKLVVADDVAYVGGVNFSDHNFGWPDLMLRVADRAVADFLAADFDRTFRGQSELASFASGSVRVTGLDGRSNTLGFVEVFQRVARARREIVVVSPYLSSPFTEALGAISRQGVKVRILTPWMNNKPLVRDALLWAASRYGFEVVLGPGMSHLKGMLIDDDHLILGSSNFDFASLASEEEFLVGVDDPMVVGDFRSRVVAPAIASAIAAPHAISSYRGLSANIALRGAALIASATRRFPRTAVDWPS